MKISLKEISTVRWRDGWSGSHPSDHIRYPTKPSGDRAQFQISIKTGKADGGNGKIRNKMNIEWQ